MKIRPDKFLCRFLASAIIIFILSNRAVLAIDPAQELIKSNTAGTQLLNGSFFQPDLVINWTDTDFSAEYDAMKEVRMNHVIWQWTVDSKKKQAYYPTSLSGFSRVSSRDLVGISLKEAKKKGLKVWLGLNWNEDWDKHYANDEKWLTNEVSLNKKVVQELWQRYGKTYANTIAGFYLPMEVDNIHFQNREKQKRMAKAYKEITETVHTTTAKPVMIAPYFNQNEGQNVLKYADMWGNILKVAPIDVIALQDGIGSGHASVSTIGKWLAVLRAKIREVRPETQLWSDLETFTPGFAPAPIGRIIRQIHAESKYVTKFTSFSFNHYDSPNNGQAEQFRQYRKYVDSLRASY
ncbi:Hypothetical protein LUCI_4784 [Lucifera butyrica]|uniref:DUF4434 domain-containing protein n=1 Tax=Lucifera butyrica TaxID=1351585 RepID=A0A498RDT7_9FIRM|nr:DUF4434 domain-containing protein [Lucifera butyrica]VBB09489.1 Hypothetical protein LUCI_4784 [Lucifera butyrica]